MTGDAAAYGEAVDNGAKLAVEEINKMVESMVSRLSSRQKMIRQMQRKL